MQKPGFTNGAAVQHLCGMLQRTFDHASPVEVFRGFVQACHLALDDLPAHLHYALTRESIAAPDSRARWDAAMGRFAPKTLEAFAEGFAVLLLACQGLGDGWSTDSIGGPDVIGSVYMDLLSGRSNKYNYVGQFFTPWNVCLMMAKMLGADEDLEGRFHREVKAMLHADPVLGVLTMVGAMSAKDAMPGDEAFFWWLQRAWPLLRPKLEPVAINDPCVGSGRMLLAYAACQPLWLSQIGYVQYTGIDLDAPCVDMARLNLRLYGLTPMRLQAATLAALEGHLSQAAGVWAPAYQAVIEAAPAEQPALQEAVIRKINRGRVEQLSLFEEA